MVWVEYDPGNPYIIAVYKDEPPDHVTLSKLEFPNETMCSRDWVNILITLGPDGPLLMESDKTFPPYTTNSWWP